MNMLRHQFLRAPLFLPLVAVGAAIPGGWWYALSGLVVLAAMGLRLWRIGMCALLCALVAALHTRLLEQRAADFCRQAEWQEVVELTGTVERTLRRGCVLSTGWNGVRVVLRGETTSAVGDVVRVRAEWQAPGTPPVRGVFDPQGWMKGMGAAASLHLVEEEKLGKPLSLRTLQHWGLGMRERMARTLMPPGTEQEAARQVLCALVLGDKSGAESETMEGFRKGGCLHAFAVSGLHVGLVSGIFWLLLRLLRVRPVVIRPLVLVAVGVYVLMTGAAVPAIRAYVMLAVVLLGYMLQRRVSLLNTWSFAALIILLVDPSQLFNAGFLLSFGVYAALCLALRLCLGEQAWFGPDDYIPVSLRTRWEMRWSNFELGVRGTVIVALSAWLVSLPITLSFFHTFNSTSFLTNVAITPLLPVVMFCGLLHLCLASVPCLGVATGWAAQKSAALLLAVVSWFGELPYAYLPAQEPAPLHSILIQGTNYGGSFTMLGNHGLLIDCGNETTAEMKTAPTLFHAGYTPAALLVTTPRVSAGGGASVLQRMWPGLPVIHAHELPPEGRVFETQAGRFTLSPAPQELPRKNAANHHPLVLWESPAGRVLYAGNAAYAALAALPEAPPDVAILGQHPTQCITPADVAAKRCILLPTAEDSGTPAAETVGPQECRRWVLP
ncbi:MAG: ComEC/Rec2 family competence protein [Akkermansia sp.]|nr:ComEC/Rec2 family competence protein [Akkermansia sp.]